MRLLISTVAALLVVSVAGCGGDDEPASDPTPAASSTTTSSEPSEPAETSEPAASPTEASPLTACSLADEAEVEAAFGLPVPAGSVGGGGHDEDGLVWKSDNCSWEVEDTLDVRLGLSVAGDFEGGKLVCPPLSYLGTESTPVPALGGGAAWVGNDMGELEGTLRLCLAEHLVDIDVETPTGSGDLAALRGQAVAFAGMVQGKLGG